nr:MAG TPA: hypothetical protein [Caudoviricetes sp.]
MKNFFCVRSEYYSDGTTKTNIYVKRAEVLPQNEVAKYPDVHIWINWYSSIDEARKAAESCRKISKKSYSATKKEEKQKNELFRGRR